MTWRTKWTPERDACVSEMFAAGHDRKAIAKVIGCTLPAISARICSLDLCHPCPNGDPTQIIREVAATHKLTTEEIKHRVRRRPIVYARQAAFARLYEETGLSLPGVARVMGGWDHSTVLHGIRQHNTRQQQGETQ